jgi:hypothetical protein
MDARCSNCGQTIRLPGRLATVATIRTRRQTDRLGVGFEIIGFISMFILFPWGFFVGAGLVYFGWRKSNAFVCSSCGGRVKNRQVESCPNCRAKFSSD